MKQNENEPDEKLKNPNIDFVTEDDLPIVSFDDFVNKPIVSFSDFEDRFGLSIHKIEALHYMLHASLGENYKGINENYDINGLNIPLSKINKRIYKCFRNIEEKTREGYINGSNLNIK